MPAQPARIDFSTGQFSSIEQLGGAAPQAINVIFDDSGAVHLRPGISAWADFATPPLDAGEAVEGLAIFGQSVVYVTADRLIHAITAPGLAVDLSDGTALTSLDGSTRPVFAVAKAAIAIAGSGALQKWDGSSPLSARLGGSPPPASHVIAISGGLVVNVLGNTGQIQWSDVDIESWPALNFVELETAPDPCIAVYENTAEVVGMGTSTVQMMDQTSATIDAAGNQFFTFLPARTFEFGVGATYSFVQFDEQFAFMDDRRRFMVSNGRSFEPISDPALTETLASLDTITDCWGFRLKAASWDLLVWIFPTDGRGFCYDLGKKKWTEWRGWADGMPAPFAGKSYAYWSQRNLHLVGMGDGTIGTFDFTSAYDLTEPVVGQVVTGFIDQNTMNYKHCQLLRLRFKRGVGTLGQDPPPKCLLSWRDDLGAFEDPIELDMGNADDPTPTIELTSLGVYRQRQWKLTMASSVPLTLISVEETFEVVPL